MVELSDEQLKGVFNDKGGNYVKEYMAATEAEAKQNFPDMLQMTRPVTVSTPYNWVLISMELCYCTYGRALCSHKYTIM